MTGAHSRRMKKFDREAVFMGDNAADFPAGSGADTLTTTIAANMAEILTRDASLTSSFDDKNQTREIKGDARDDLIELEEDIVTAAKGIGDAAVPGITAQFRMPESRSEPNLIAKATAMHDETAAPLEDLFIAAGLTHTFRNDLIVARDAFQQSIADVAAAAGHHAEAVGALSTLFRETMDLSRQRSALVQLKYRTNPGKLAAWTVASHLDKAPEKKPKPPAPPTP